MPRTSHLLSDSFGQEDGIFQISSGITQRFFSKKNHIMSLAWNLAGQDSRAEDSSWTAISLLPHRASSGCCQLLGLLPTGGLPSRGCVDGCQCSIAFFFCAIFVLLHCSTRVSSTPSCEVIDKSTAPHLVYRPSQLTLQPSSRFPVVSL